MFGLGFTEVVVIFVVALLVLGPSGLPELARTLGRYSVMFRRTLDDLKHEIRISELESFETRPLDEQKLDAPKPGNYDSRSAAPVKPGEQVPYTPVGPIPIQPLPVQPLPGEQSPVPQSSEKLDTPDEKKATKDIDSE